MVRYKLRNSCEKIRVWARLRWRVRRSSLAISLTRYWEYGVSFQKLFGWIQAWLSFKKNTREFGESEWINSTRCDEFRVGSFAFWPYISFSTCSKIFVSTTGLFGRKFIIEASAHSRRVSFCLHLSILYCMSCRVWCTINTINKIFFFQWKRGWYARSRWKDESSREKIRSHRAIHQAIFTTRLLDNLFRKCDANHFFFSYNGTTLARKISQYLFLLCLVDTDGHEGKSWNYASIISAKERNKKYPFENEKLLNI